MTGSSKYLKSSGAATGVVTARLLGTILSSIAERLPLARRSGDVRLPIARTLSAMCHTMIAALLAVSSTGHANQTPNASSGAGPVVKTYPSGLTATYALSGSTTINVADGVLNGFGGVSAAQLSPSIDPLTKGMQLVVSATNCNAAVATCANRGTMTVTFSRSVTNPVLHISGLGGSSGSNLLAARMIITGVTGAATLPTYTRLSGTSNFGLQSTTSAGAVAANGGTTCSASPDAGCGSVRLNGTFTSVTFRFDLVMSGTTVITSTTAGDGIGLTFSVDEDFGDAPTSYESGAVASHIVGGLFLGDSITADNTGVTNPGTLTPSPLANASAAGDGAENGATFPALLAQGQPATIDVAVTGTGGFLQGWIDWGDDGNFNAGSDRIATNAVDGGAGDTDGAANGVIRLAVTPPSTAATTPTIARFRLSSRSGLGISGLAADGEVEDYELTVTPVAELAISKTNGVSSVFSGLTTTYTVTVTNSGPSSVTGALIKDTPVSGLTCLATDPVSISGNGVPAGSFTISNLTGSGIALGMLASGQSATLTYSCKVN